MLLGVGHGTGKKRPRDTLPAILRRNDEADNRPDGLIVDRLHNRRARQPRVPLLWVRGKPNRRALCPGSQ